MISATRDIWKSVYLTLLVSRLAGGILQLIMFGVVAHELGSNIFGPMIAALVSVQLIGTVFDFGFGALLMSRQFFIENRSLVGTLLSSNILISVLEVSIGLICYLFVSIQSSFLTAFFVLLTWGAGERLTNIGLSFAIMQDNPREVRRNILSRRLIAFVCFCAITSQVSWTMLNFCIFLGVSSLVGGAISVFRYRDYLAKCKWKNFFTILKFGFPYQVNSFINQFRNLDVLLLNFFVSPSVAGNYALALRFSQPFSILLSTLGQTGITAFSSNILSKRSDFLERYIRIVRNCLFLGFTIVFFPVKRISNNFFQDYPHIESGFKIQCIAFILFGVIAVETSILQGIGKQNFIYKISTLFILLTLITTLVGGYFFGIVGASVGLLTGNLMQAIQLYISRQGSVKSYE